MQVIVDRIEGTFAVCECPDKTMMGIPLEEFEQEPKDGDVVEYEDHRARLVEEETQELKEQIEDLFASLLKQD